MRVGLLSATALFRLSSRNKASLVQSANNQIRNNQSVLLGVKQLGSDLTYTKQISKSIKGKISLSMLLEINNRTLSVCKFGEEYDIDGYRFTANQIPKIDGIGLGEIKAENNVMDFGKNQYFKYVSEDGKEHYLFADNEGIGFILSEYFRGAPHDGVLENYAAYWRYMMTKDPVYIGLQFSEEEIRHYMGEAGLKESSFFTVKMGDRESVKYYSAGSRQGIIHAKEYYDEHYSHMTSGGILYSEFKPGSIFKIGGIEYKLKEDHTLDLPYGADIYDIEYPKII